MTTEIELLRAIAANLDEDTPRLIYADWLDEHAAPNNSHAAKAEFIRLQIELARAGAQMTQEQRDPLEKRKWKLEMDHHREWEKGIHEALGYSTMFAVYERGLIESLTVTNPDRLISSQILSASTLTVRNLTMESVADNHMPTLAAQLDRSRIVKLSLRTTGWERDDPDVPVLTDAAMEYLSGLKNIRQLSLIGGGRITAAGAALIASRMSGLEELAISNNPIGDDGAARIAAIGNLRKLSLIGGGRITATGAALIASRMSGLEELAISNNPIGNDGAARIAAMSNLRKLNLNGCGITRVGAEAIATSSTLPFAAKATGLETAGFPEMAAELARTETPTAREPKVEWFRTNWRGHPGEVLFRTPVGEMAPAQVALLREQVIGTLVHDGFSRGSAEASVVVRHSEEMGQDSLTVIGNAASIALMKAVGRGQHPGVFRGESHWRDRPSGPALSPNRTNNGHE